MNSELIDDITENKENQTPLYEALSWWERKRTWFNLFVGISGLIPIILYASHFSVFDIIGLLLYGIVMNIFYSTGFLLEALNIFYSTKNLYLSNLRFLFLVLGTFLSSVVPFLWSIMYYNW